LKEDHDFWLCVCYHNIGMMENDIAIIKRGIHITEEIESKMGNATSNALQKIRQSKLLEKLKKMETENMKS
jgi:hypothetical protein